MPINLAFDMFAIPSEADTNDAVRPGQLMLEIHYVSQALSSGTASVSLTSKLNEVIGVIPLISENSTDKVVGASVSLSGSTATLVLRAPGSTTGTVTGYFALIGKQRSSSTILNSPV